MDHEPRIPAIENNTYIFNNLMFSPDGDKYSNNNGNRENGSSGTEVNF